MKKRFWIGATVLSILLTFSILFASVYAALSQNIGIKNTISFAGVDEILKFTVDGQITGTKNDSEENHQVHWEYDYELFTPSNFDWQVGNLEFENEGKTVDQVHITYTFVIKNQSSCAIIAEFEGPNKHLADGEEGEIVAGLIGTHYVSLKDKDNNEKTPERKGKSIKLGLNETATLKFKLTIKQMEDYTCNEEIDFAINFLTVSL